MFLFCLFVFVYHIELHVGFIQAGMWTLELTNVASAGVQNDVTIIVQSRARTNGDPIRATATWGKESVNIRSDTVETNNQTLFVAVSKGMILHIKARVCLR